MANKQAQGLPINVIIIAILALIALVIIAVMFTGNIRIFSQTLEDCEAKQGTCKPNCNPSTEAKITNAKCPKDKPQVCCIEVFNT